MAIPVLNSEQLAHLRNKFQAYSEDSHYRANALFIRSRAHALIRELTAPDNLPKLSLNDFDRHVWQLGGLRIKNQSLTWHQASQPLAETDPDQFAMMLSSGEASFVGNVSWGSAVNTLRAFAHGRPHDELEATMRQALTLLLHQPSPVESHLRQLRNLKTGFGRNICSGLLMVWNPREFILYNALSERFWAGFDLGFPAGSNWVKNYLRYNEFCQALLGNPGLSLRDLVDLDTFIYWYSSVKSVPVPQETAKASPKHTQKATFVRQESAGSTSEFQWRGKQYTISKQTLLSQARHLLEQGLPKEALRYRTWAVFVGEQPVSVKWLFSLATGADYSDFNASTARRALSRIGIEAQAVAPQTPPTPQESPHIILKDQIAQIRRFLHGRAARPSDEVLCDWVQFCYTFKLFAEGYELFQMIEPSAVNDWLYQRTKRLARVCHIRSG